MDFSLTEQQRILGRSARQFLEAECPAAVVREAETTEQGHVPELWEKMADLGWLGMSLPEMYGGTGGSLTDQVVLFEEIGRALVPGPLLVSSVLASQIVLNAGNDSQKESLLPGIASGGLI
ncbi:MAG: acyl-CoA dehydrogenase family protein, partial [Chloroflexota bacterium]|nr:acyl-CoA dehydrogenase family protein [Chloroflexota bacterium]